VSSPVQRFASGTYKVCRFGAGKYIDGFYEQGKLEEICVKGSLQPTNARELKIPEEGARLKQFWKFYTDQPIVTIGTRRLSKADVVTINGETYKVWSQEIWQGFRLAHYKAILYREPEQ